MDSPRSQPDEIQSLRRCLRDVVALPAVWSGREPLAIAESLADLLLNTLWLDVVYVVMGQPGGQPVAEVARARPPLTPEHAREAGRRRLQSPDHRGLEDATVAPDPLGEGVLRAVALPVGHDAEWGRVVVAARRTGFPGEVDRLLVSVAANQAVVSLQEATLLQTARQSEARKAQLLALEQSQADLRRLARRLQAAREEERGRIAREVHDVLGGMLTRLKMDVASSARYVDGDRDLLLTRLKAMSAQIDDAVHVVRRIATGLRPGVLDDFGLVAAIEWQMQDLQGRAGLDCRLDLKLTEVALPAEHATALFRIYEETLTNVVRHAQATQVTVRLEEDHGHLVLQVRDNGRGITPQEARSAASLGLLDMRERVRLLDGEMQVEGAPGQGTNVIVRIPFPARPAAMPG